MFVYEPVAAYVQQVHVPVPLVLVVLQTLLAVLLPDPHDQPVLTVPDWAVSDVAASSACVTLYVPSATQS